MFRDRPGRRTRQRSAIGGLDGAARWMFRALSATCLAAAAPAQAPLDPLAGRWELNLARTHYGGGAEPRRRESFSCIVIAATVKCSIESVRVDGRSVRGGFTATYDGSAGPTDGIPDVDHVRLARVSGSIADATFTRDGIPVFAYRAVQSSSGKSLTIVSVDPVSRAVLNSVVVYDRR